MRSSRFALISSALSLAIFLPFLIFVFLKYYGLNDTFMPYLGEQEEYADDEYSPCSIRFEFPNAIQIVTTEGSQGSQCGVVICEGDCGLRLVSPGVDLNYATNADIELKVLSTYKSEFGDEEAVPEDQDPDPDEPAETENVGDTGFIDGWVQSVSNRNYGYPFWQWASIFSIAIGFCFLGYCSSVAIRDGRLDATFRIRNSIVVGALYSFISGSLTVALFAGGFLQGSLFPNFSGDIEDFGFNSWAALKFRGQDWFKLAVWGYIVGWSESFLPGILARLMQDATRDKAAGGQAEQGREDGDGLAQKKI